MSETPMEQTQRIDLDALEAAHHSGIEVSGYIERADYERIYGVWDALPALIAELRQLRARTTPEVISSTHKDGNYWLIGDEDGWWKCRWNGYWERWQHSSGTQFLGTPTHALPMPEKVKP